MAAIVTVFMILIPKGTFHLQLALSFDQHSLGTLLPASKREKGINVDCTCNWERS